jgi:hypothetical protein
MGVDFLNTEYFFKRLYLLFANHAPSETWTIILHKINQVLDILIIPSTLASLLLLTGIVYAHIRTHQLEEEENARLGIVHGHGDEDHEEGHEPVVDEVKVNQKWLRVQKHINSLNQSDWRLAILESDIMLDEMLESMGYRAESLGQKLKSIEKSDFTTLDKAWEAHTVRNSIAHQGADFLINDREARRVIGLYEEVFREFHYI